MAIQQRSNPPGNKHSLCYRLVGFPSHKDRCGIQTLVQMSQLHSQERRPCVESQIRASWMELHRRP